MRAYEEIKNDVLNLQVEFERFMDNPDSFSQDEHGRPVDLMRATDALEEELTELMGPEVGPEEYSRILISSLNGFLPEEDR